ncbi:hypothetical protein ACJJTC_007218 [Scirpophaga incertulas]
MVRVRNLLERRRKDSERKEQRLFSKCLVLFASFESNTTIPTQVLGNAQAAGKRACMHPNLPFEGEPVVTVRRVDGALQRRDHSGPPNNPDVPCPLDDPDPPDDPKERVPYAREVIQEDLICFNRSQAVWKMIRDDPNCVILNVVIRGNTNCCVICGEVEGVQRVPFNARIDVFLLRDIFIPSLHHW